ncbi:PRTRC system protein A [Novosphingobium sp.]|uniref:PRTRC system protein A n=1 Tax=Novosphingobium sp. TaxID=1874826 RepID=UPI003BAD2453
MNIFPLVAPLLADDQTAAAVLDAVPCYPVPPSGSSPAIDALRASRAGHGFIVGRDGMMLILRRPWLALDYRVTEGPECHAPYGDVGADDIKLRCGLIPGDLLEEATDQFHAALPNEAAAFVLWNERTGEFALEFPAIDEATPSRLVYRTPQPGPDLHVVVDMHSHGRGGAFFSATDNADDAHATKIAMVLGHVDQPENVQIVTRLCASGMFISLKRFPFDVTEEPADAA